MRFICFNSQKGELILEMAAQKSSSQQMPLRAESSRAISCLSHTLRALALLTGARGSNEPQRGPVMALPSTASEALVDLNSEADAGLPART